MINNNITTNSKLFEKSLLACLFIENGAGLPDVDLKISDFYDANYRNIYGAIVNVCIRDGQPFDISLIVAELKKIDENRDWIVDISELLDFTPNTFNPQIYAEKIRELSIERQRLSLINDFTVKKIGADEFLQKFITIGENYKKEQEPAELDLFDMSKMFIKPAPLKFIFQGFREATVGIFAGTGGSGKSYMSLAFLLSYADTTCRLNYLNLFTERRGKCGYISLEDDAELIHHRLYNLRQFFGIEQTNTELLQNLKIKNLYGKNFNLAEKNFNKIEINKEAEHKLYDFCLGKKFVVIDTLRRLSNLNENDSSEMSHILRTIEKISFQTGCAILINSHVSKAEQDGKNKVRGASSITDDTRFTLLLDKKLVKNEKGNYDKKQLFLFFEKVNAIKIPEPIPLEWQEWISKETLEAYSMITLNDTETQAVSYNNIIEIENNKRPAGRPRTAGKAGEL